MIELHHPAYVFCLAARIGLPFKIAENTIVNNVFRHSVSVLNSRVALAGGAPRLYDASLQIGPSKRICSVENGNMAVFMRDSCRHFLNHPWTQKCQETSFNTRMYRGRILVTKVIYAVFTASGVIRIVHGGRRFSESSLPPLIRYAEGDGGYSDYGSKRIFRRCSAGRKGLKVTFRGLKVTFRRIDDIASLTQQFKLSCIAWRGRVGH